MNGPLLRSTVLARLWRFKGKSVFMGMGITVGVLATVLLLTAAASVRARFRVFIERAYPADGIVVFAGGGPMNRSAAGRGNLRLADLEAAAAAAGIAEWDPMVFAGPRTVAHEGNSITVGVMGLSDQAERVRRRSVQDGAFLSADEVRARARVALIGATTAARLFPGESPVGRQVFIDNVGFDVRGVLETRGADPHGQDQDNTIALPYTTLMDSLLRTTAVSGGTFLAADRNRVDEVAEEIAGVIRRRHQIGEGQADDFTVFTAASMNAMFRHSFRTFDLFLPLISAAVFLISALVILSILQIGVRARRGEIGLRKAAGARARDVEAQVLLEVVAVAAVATAVGLVLAWVGCLLIAPVLAQKFGVTDLRPTLLSTLVALGAALATAIAGALLPARRAARLDPISSLRG